MDTLEQELKQLLIDTFDLEGVSIADIASDIPLFGEGLGLDSIDALELGIALRKKYHIHIDTGSADLVGHFASVRSLTGFVVASQQQATQ